MKHRGLPIFFFTLLLSTSCTEHRNYWVAKEICSQDRPIDWAMVPHHEFGDKFHRNLRVVEYDDNGDRWERMQVVSALEAIGASPMGSPVVVFMHGWRNNAHHNNGNLASFNEFLGWWEAQDQKGENPKHREIVGIYLGWRGASVHEDGPHKLLMTLPMALSFPDRRLATTRVAGVPLASDLWAIRNAAIRNKSKLILVGHSFGGRIIEQVTAQSIIAYHNSRTRYALKDDEDKTKDTEIPAEEKKREFLIADLVVLINPASESLNARQIKLALRSWPDKEPPAVICLSSETDAPNRNLWPIGKNIEALGDPFRAAPARIYQTGHHSTAVTDGTERQWTYESTTAGFHEEQIGAVVDYDHGSGSFSFSEHNLDNHGMSNRGYLVLRAKPCLLDGHNNDKSNCEGCSAGKGLFSEPLSKFVTRIVEDATSGNYPETQLYRWLHPR